LQNKPIDVKFFVILFRTNLSGNITYFFSSIVAFLNEVVFIDIKYNLRNKMGFRRKLYWLILVLMSLFLFTGCGDLEPEMQDTRTVILNMDFDQRSSSRTSRVDPAELINYKTHLIMVLTSEIMVLTSGKNLSNNNYWDYKDSNQGEYVLYDSDREITLNMKLNTKMKIFAFLFRENYSHYDLFSAKREAGYYGESQSFSIGTNTNSLEANIRLTQVSGLILVEVRILCWTPQRRLPASPLPL